jgi:hypothetical protein
MKERKSITILKLLGNGEIDSLRKFLSSPYFNQRKEMVDFLEHALSYFNTKEKKISIPNEEMWTKIFDSPYDDLKFRKLSSDFNHLVEEFLIQEEFKKDQQGKTVLKVKAITSRGGDELYESLRHDVVYGRKIDPNRNAEYYLHNYELEKLIFKLIPDDERKRDFKDINIDKISENLDIYFISEKLKYYSDILSWNQIYNTSLNMRGIEIVKKLANNPLFRDIPTISIYRKIIKLNTNQGDESIYFEIKNEDLKNLYLFPKTEAMNILGNLLNYTIGKVNNGNRKYAKESLDLYIQALDSDLILNNGLMEISDYRNIVFMGLRVGEIEWVSRFIEDYKNHLDPVDKENAYFFSLSRLEIYKKNFSKVIEYLNKLNNNDIWYNLNGRSSLIVSYYELNEMDVLESQILSFKTYINREKLLIKSRKQNYIDFIKFVAKLIKYTKNDTAKLRKMRAEIESTVGVINKQWLLEKTDELLKK